MWEVTVPLPKGLDPSPEEIAWLEQEISNKLVQALFGESNAEPSQPHQDPE